MTHDTREDVVEFQGYLQEAREVLGVEAVAAIMHPATAAALFTPEERAKLVASGHLVVHVSLDPERVQVMAKRLAREMAGLLGAYDVQVPAEARDELEERLQGVLLEEGGT